MKNEFKEFIKSEEQKLEEREKALQILQDEISEEKSQLDTLIKKNQELIDAIDGKIADKSANIYNKMKAKVASGIFDQMMLEGEVDKVFTILIKLKPKHVAKILKYMDITNSTIISELMIKKGSANDCKESN
jgi:flagellar motility protein MotE (MotC chaperone)